MYSYSILIVDDEKIERRGIKFLLNKIDVEFKIYESSNGKEALEFLKDNKVDIIFTDIKMPFIDGIQLIKEVKKMNIDSKIVIFSGFEEFEYAKFATKMGVLNYILKPVNPDEFKETILKIVNDIEKENNEKEVKNKNISFMKQHILYSIFNGITIDEIKNRTNNLINLNFLESYSNIMLLEFNTEFFDKKDIDFKKLINNDLEINCEYLNLNIHQSLLIFNKDEDNIDNLINIANKIHDNILKLFNTKCYIAFGRGVNDINDFFTQFQKVELLMERKFYYTDEYIFVDNDKANVSVDTNDDKIVKQIKSDIKLKDIDMFTKDFHTLCEKYGTVGDFSQIYVKFIFTDILKELYKNIDGILENEFKEDINKLFKCSDFCSVIKLINSYVDKLKNKIDSNVSSVHKEIEGVKKFILDNYEKDLSVDLLASHVCLAPSYLSYIFKKETGQNLSKFIKSCRMNKAKDMLENSFEKIVDISYAVGYRNVSYFCQSFREYFGVSPQKYRNEGDTFEENI